jgi:hypothetical protein
MHEDAMRARIKTKDKDADLEDPEIKAKIESFEEMDYIAWMQNIDKFHLIPRVHKYKNKQYFEYLEKLGE